MVIYLNIKKGDYVSRNSYNNDIVFKVININNSICYLKGEEVRLYADSPIEDLKKEKHSKPSKSNIAKEIASTKNDDRNNYFYLPGKILHIDGDADFLNRCLEFYKDAGILAVGKKIAEKNIHEQIKELLEEYRPDIAIITGHDAYYRKKGSIDDINNYKNTKYFIRAVKEARKYEKSHEKLVIIAGACQSDYEELIKAGANFASSPKRVNIHALDPAIIASTIALTKRSEQIDLISLLEKTKYGKDGIGGIIGNGVMYVGYPR